jgi:hypothetical protein
MVYSERILYRQQKGTIRKNWNLPGVIKLDSAVIITAAQFVPDENHIPNSPIKTAGRPLLGSANVYVTNIGPHGVEGVEDGGVEFLLHVDWGDPLDVIVTITVLDPINAFVAA